VSQCPLRHNRYGHSPVMVKFRLPQTHVPRG